MSGTTEKDSPLNREWWKQTIADFESWIRAKDDVKAREWRRRLDSQESAKAESAIAEAGVWRYLLDRADTIWPGESTKRGGMDFRVSNGASQYFVEVTNISIGAATKACKMPHGKLFKGHHGLLTSRIRQKVRKKLKQSRQESELPVLVAVTTLHSNASTICIHHMAVEFAMGSPPSITGHYNSTTGMTEGDIYQSTDLSCSVFLTPCLHRNSDGQPIATAKFEPISGFLLVGLGNGDGCVNIYGALNPEASRPFNHTLLSGVPFCRFKQWPAAESISFRWTITPEEEIATRVAEARQRLIDAGAGDLLELG